MNRGRTTLSALTILLLASVLAVGELVSGTNLFFVSMVVLAFLSACVTYNLLGGLRSISGIAFSRFALVTFVISQFCKIFLFEPADRNLDAPDLTITVYAVFFISLALGTFVFFPLRLRLPKPAEPKTATQSRYLYVIALVAGLSGTIALVAMQFQGAGAEETLTHSYARALAYFLPFSLVLAVDDRIKTTEGRHSISWRVLVPATAMILEGFIGGTRQGFVEPFLIVFLTSYLRGYRFRFRHAFAGIAVLAIFFLFVSPFYLYVRNWRGQPTIKQQFSTALRLLESAPAQWQSILNTVSEAPLSDTRLVNYFDKPWAVTLNRLALIGPDSTLIAACSRNYHYGFTSIRMDYLSEVPRFLVRDKPEFGSEPFLGHLDGQESDAAFTSHSTITPVSDSFGAFGFLSVVIFAFFVPPLIFVVYESIFDMGRPWGTVATVILLISFTETSMGVELMATMIRQPIYLVVISIFAEWVVRMIPAFGDRFQRSRSQTRLFQVEP